MEKYRVCVYTLIMLIWFILLLSPENILAQNNEREQEFYDLYEQVVDNYRKEEFDEAIRMANIIRDRFPDEPAGALGLITTFDTVMRNYRVRCYESKFDSLLKLSVNLAKSAVKKNKRDGRNYFYLGCAYGSRSIYNARRGKWIDAFRDGSQVLKNFKRAVAYSPEFYDAYYGIGLYKYWLGAKSKILRVLPISRNNRNEGIEQIRLAVEKGRFLKVDAMYGLTAIYYNEEEFEKVLEISERLYRDFPTNPTLLYRRGRTYQQLGRWSEAKQMFDELDAVLKSAKYQSTSYQIERLYQTAKCQYRLNNLLDAQRLCQEAIALEKHCDFSQELDGPLEKFSEIKKQLHELNEQIESVILTEARASREE